MHRCIAILGPEIHVLYRDLSIAILIAIRITYRDQCIPIRDTYHGVWRKLRMRRSDFEKPSTPFTSAV